MTALFAKQHDTHIHAIYYKGGKELGGTLASGNADARQKRLQSVELYHVLFRGQAKRAQSSSGAYVKPYAYVLRVL